MFVASNARECRRVAIPAELIVFHLLEDGRGQDPLGVDQSVHKHGKLFRTHIPALRPAYLSAVAKIISGSRRARKLIRQCRIIRRRFGIDPGHACGPKKVGSYIIKVSERVISGKSAVRRRASGRTCKRRRCHQPDDYPKQSKITIVVLLLSLVCRGDAVEGTLF